MAEKLHTTRRAVLSGLAAMPLAAVPAFAAPPTISWEQAVAALQAHIAGKVQPGNGWVITIDRNPEYGGDYVTVREVVIGPAALSGRRKVSWEKIEGFA